MLDSLYRCKFIKTGKSRIKVVVRTGEKGKINCYLTGATMQENNLFIDSLKETLEKTVNQRYIIVRLNKNYKKLMIIIMFQQFYHKTKKWQKYFIHILKIG